MKKLLVLLTVLALFLVSCGGTETKPETTGAGQTTVADADIAKSIIGDWQAETLGVFLEQYGFTAPARLLLTEDGKYEWYFTLSGKYVGVKGTYKVTDTSAKPYKFDFMQTHVQGPDGAWVEKSRPAHGIFEVGADGKLVTAFLDAINYPRPDELNEAAQVYTKK
ncbi:MAG TPA: hypothetical protein DHW82_12845 [Spirochaetia bacterium]|nr:MAG: hypothetical protein A2Y41_03305 [Spirochaetes bacterium GWB1_36_13]HCL57877.1 hypothetical protein [Spirochaetia bacterium]